MKQGVRPHHGDEGVAVRLHVAFFVGRAADDLGGLAVPGPIHLKACLGLRQRRKFNCASFQVLAPSVLISTFAILPWPLQASPEMRLYPGRICIVPDGCVITELVSILQLELPGLPVGEKLGVAGRLPAGHPRLVAELQAAQPFDIQIAFQARHDQPDAESRGRV